MDISKTIGRHDIKIAGDVLFIKFNGRFSGTDAAALIPVIEQAFQSQSYYALLDSSEMGKTDAVARKRFIAWASGRKFLGVAIFGANLTTRTLTILVQSGSRLLGKKIIPLEFVKEIEEGRAWIAEQKRKAVAHGDS